MVNGVFRTDQVEWNGRELCGGAALNAVDSLAVVRHSLINSRR